MYAFYVIVYEIGINIIKMLREGTCIYYIVREGGERFFRGVGELAHFCLT